MGCREAWSATGAPFPFRAILVIFLLVARALFGRDLTARPERVVDVMRLDEREAIIDPGLLVRSLLIVLGVTAAFLLQGVLGYEPAVVALLGAGILLGVSGRDVGELAQDVEWETLAFFAGLFIMVGALVEVGAIESITRAAGDLTGDSTLAATLLILSLSAILSAIVDNIPYVAAMAPVVGSLSTSLGSGDVLWWALALGTDLGGNATIIGASANVVVIGIAARSGHPISFIEFLRYGAVVTAISILVSALYLWLRYFLLS